ncbi:MAG: hypothetical protein KF782_16520 [Labilithrix sp.]|nr:hypothetical protein [Labilithrix sp.]
MRIDPSPLDTLRAIAERGGTGEFICASSTVEVHVYLQRGRLAWATDSEHPFAFTRHLQRSSQIDGESFRDILDSCRRERRPLGETLVSWGVATWDEVRDALRHQLALALAVLRGGGPAQTLFLDRTEQFAKYEPRLTFDVAEMLADHEGSSRAAPRTDAGEGARSAPRGSLAGRLLDAADGILWAQTLDGTNVAESAPEPAERARFETDIVRGTVLDGAELVTLRAPEGTLAGVALDASRSLWCRLTTEATVGAAISALSGFAASERASSDVTGAGPVGAPWVVGAHVPVVRDLEDFLGRAPETLAALMTDLDGGSWSCGAGASLASEYAFELARRRAHVLASPSPFGADDAPPAADDVDLSSRSMLTRERTVWCFGAELDARPRKILWLLLHRQSSQGLGWAYLTSLSRRLMHARGWRDG